MICSSIYVIQQTWREFYKIGNWKCCRNCEEYCHPPGSGYSPVAVSGTWQNKTDAIWPVGWAGSCFEYIGIKTQFVAKRKKMKKKPNQTGNILRNCYKTITRKTSCLYLNREKRPDASLAEEDIRHEGSSGRLSKLKWLETTLG